MQAGAPRRITRLARVVVGTCPLLALPTTQAADSTAQIHISVAVPRHATIVESTEPRCLAAPAVDSGLRLAAAAYRVRNTSSAGIELIFEPALAMRSLGIRIVDRTGVIEVPAPGGAITLRDQPPGETVLDVEYRIELETDDVPDCIGWPVRVEARPL